MGQESCAVEDREDGQTEIAPTSRGVAPPADPGKMWVSFSSFFSIFTSPLRQSARCFGHLLFVYSSVCNYEKSDTVYNHSTHKTYS